ncbi:hypothetical protein N802_10550 [Knoellia sinensis KCTC 19936]|uniref:DUF3180 domain-containing protein n=1 Tax=Knoellia sinensis KCTC 19936 TaxID=1385520 RepID=A0A0A0J978_9MICO|nr:DUF3180 domain-containing protein [Knoellia sinensis]KGN32166.1 hypothetical protein N802_10550 [Knoellia sinensis KCTC 19936]
MVNGRGVRPGVALLVALVVGGGSWLLWQLITSERSLVPRPSWLAAVLLAAMAAFVVGFAWPVRSYLAGRSTRPFDPLRAARVVVLAQAATLTGAAAVGWYAGQLAVVAGDLSLVANESRLWRLAILVAAALILTVAGLVAQHWCQVEPPADDD